MIRSANDPVIITALDFSSQNDSLSLCDQLDPALTHLKIGKELFTRSGPDLVTTLQARGFRIFLDLKFHDIPNTVAGALHAAVDLGVWMVNVHACGGRRMLEAAREAVPANGNTLLIGVTVLTSLSDEDLAETGITSSAQSQVERLASLSQSCGLDGVVCSPQESASLKLKLGQAFLTVTPGVRPNHSAVSDQRRVMTPRAAIEAGSDYLVIGRPITQAANPLQALQSISDDLHE